MCLCNFYLFYLFIYLFIFFFFASASACSFPAIWQCRGIHCNEIRLCLALSCHIMAWQSLASVDIIASVDTVIPFIPLISVYVPCESTYNSINM